MLQCLDNPLRQGMSHILPKYYVSVSMSHEHVRKGIHFASNYGIANMIYDGTTHIHSPDGTKIHIIVQLTEGLVIDYSDNSFVDYVSLKVNVSKLMSGCHTFGFNGSFDDILESMKEEGYQFIKPNEGGLISAWLVRVQNMVSERRKIN